MSVLKWGIASCGRISGDWALTLATLSGHKLVAVAARKLEDAKKFADKHGAERAYEGYEDLGKDDDVQCVYIGSLNITHFNIAKMMIENGKNVLCEKPLCMNYKETKFLVELAKEKNVFLMEAMWSRTNPVYRTLRAEIEAGTIGVPLQVEAAFGFKMDSTFGVKMDRILKKELGGGTTLDLGVYTVHLANWVFGSEKPEKILAGGHLNSDGIDESTSVTLVYSKGRTATFMTHARVELTGMAHVYGSKGKMAINFPLSSPSCLEGPFGKKEFPVPQLGGKSCYINPGNMTHEAIHVKECLDAGLKESPLVPHNDSLIVAEILTEIRRQLGVFYPHDQ